jgi:exodeoxyribonuclease VII large subunit
LPFFPKKVGVVTSSSGAAIRDIITVIKRRCPVVDIVLYPVLVQGTNAPASICEGLKYLDNREDIDVIILGRGGGSLEELFTFNDETIARTIYHMKKPIISAVGHETDYTIADFVADLRAPTPSAAAEMVTPDVNEMLNILYEKYNRLVKSFLIKRNEMSIRLDYLYSNLNFYNPINRIRDLSKEQDMLLKRLILLMKMRLSEARDRIENLYKAIQHLNPTFSLDRGYGIVVDMNGKVISDVEDVSVEEYLKVFIKNGMLEVKVVNISKEGLYKNED